MTAGAGLLVALIGCESADDHADRAPDGAAAETSLVAFSEEVSGNLVFLDLASGDRRVLDGPGPFGSVSFAKDGARVSYVNADRDVFIATVDGQVQLLDDTGWYAPSLRWEIGGWLWYPEGSSTESSTVIVWPDAGTTRREGTTGFVRVAGSPVEPRLAFIDCGEGSPCPGDLIVERPDGSDRSELATGLVSKGVTFSPDGSHVVTAELRGDQVRAIARPINGGVDVDLGPGDDQMYLYGPPPGLSLFSPDGAEVLSVDGSRLLALRIDGSGQRTVAETGPTYPWHAGFTPAGEVLFMEEINTEDPPDDTPVFVYTTRVAAPDGSVRVLRELDPLCGISMISSTVASVSGDGSLLAYDCGIVQRISDGATVAELPSGGRPLGFTSGGQVVYLADTTLVLVGLDGSLLEVATTFGSENVDVFGLQAAYFGRGLAPP